MRNFIKKPLFPILACMLMGVLMISSCGDDDDANGIEPANKTALAAAIQEAQALLDNSEEGNAEGQFPASAFSALQTAVTAANAIMADETISQTAVDNAVVALNNAINAFKAAVIEPIAFEDLVAHWRFDEGSGTTAADASPNGLDGSLEEGHPSLEGSGGVPEWTTDRHGDANKALKFDAGAHVLVPFNLALNPREITISLWAYLDEEIPWANNYMVAQNYWEGYKFQIQDAPKSFFTCRVTGGTIYDRDNDQPVLEPQQWYHLAVTFKDGEMTFFIEGTEVRKWDDTPGELIVLEEPIDFVIGQERPSAAVDPEIDWILPHFRGNLDEVRIYKKALSASQIESIYELEKP